MLQEARFYGDKYSPIIGIVLSQDYEPLYVTAWYDDSEDTVKLSYSYDNVEYNVIDMQYMNGAYWASITVYGDYERREQAHISCVIESNNLVMHIV